MKRPALALGAAALILVLGSGAWWLARRDPGIPPQEEALEPFRSEPMGAGQLIDLQPPSMPLRSVRWTPPLPGGVAVAQILTQTGRQQAVLFQQGVPGPVFSLPEPSGVPDGFFRFADLADAALAPDDALVLLYRSSTDPSSPSLVLACDLRSQQVRWSFRAPGEHLTLSADHRSVFLFGGSTPVNILELAGRPGQPKPASTPVGLPPEVKTVSSLLPIGRRAFAVAHDSGLSTWRDGAWTHVPAPAPSPLGFPHGLGRIAGDAKGGWWQPEPGALVPLGPDAKTGPSRDLKALLPDSSSLDASLLQLLGEEPDGHLWFGLTRPTLPLPAPAPDSPAAAPTDAPPIPDDSGQALQTPVTPPATTATIQPSREDWQTYIDKGLDRLYLWKPGEERMKVVSIADAWKRLAPPPSASTFPGLGNLRPEAGALLCGGPERTWWLPLKALRPR